MQDLGNMVLYLGAGAVGGVIGMKLKIPGSVLICSMLAVIALKIVLASDWVMPRYFNTGVQIMLGVLVGSGYTPELARLFTKVAVPVVCSTLLLVGAGLVMAIILVKMGVLNIPDAYLSTSPGAMGALLSLSLDASANPGIVAAFHFFRVTFIILTAPSIFYLMQSFFNKP